MKCAKCGYELQIIESNSKVEVYHTGEEEGFNANRYCVMVHSDKNWKKGGMNNQDKATLSLEDKLKLIKSIIGDKK